MENEFWVLKEDDNYFPMAFISPADAAGEIRKQNFKLENGEVIVKIKMIELN